MLYIIYQGYIRLAVGRAFLESAPDYPPIHTSKIRVMTCRYELKVVNPYIQHPGKYTMLYAIQATSRKHT